MRKLSSESPRDPRHAFETVRIKLVRADAGAGWEPRRAEPTEKQVEYALSLAGRWESQGDSLYSGMTRERFQAMSKHEISNWINIAKSEMGLEDI